MIRLVSTLIRKMVAKIEKVSSAASNLRNEIRHHLRDEFLVNTKFDKFLYKLNSDIQEINSLTDPEDVYERFIDRFIDEKVATKIQLKLMKFFEEKDGLSEDDALKVIWRGTLNDKLQTVLGKYTSKLTSDGKPNPHYDEVGKMLGSYLAKTFHFWIMEWSRSLRRKKKEQEGYKVEEEVLPEHELEERAKKEFAWEPELIANLKRHIDDIAPKNRVPIYKAILENRFMSSGKTLKDIGKEFGESFQTVHNYEKALFKMLKDYLSENPDIMKHTRYPKPEDMEIPDYQIFMKNNPELQKDLYNWLDGQFKTGKREPSELTLKALKLFSEGKSNTEVIKVLESNSNTVAGIKSRNFNDEYEKWYREWSKKQGPKTASLLLATLGFVDYDNV